MNRKNKSTYVIIIVCLAVLLGSVDTFARKPSFPLKGLHFLSRDATIEVKTAGFVTTLIFSPDGTSLIAGTDYGRIAIYNSKNLYGKPVTLSAGRCSVSELACSPNGRFLAATSHKIPGPGSPVVDIWDLNSQKLLHTIPCMSSATAASAVFSRDGQNIWVWEHTNDGKPRRTQVFKWNVADPKAQGKKPVFELTEAYHQVITENSLLIFQSHGGLSFRELDSGKIVFDHKSEKFVYFQARLSSQGNLLAVNTTPKTKNAYRIPRRERVELWDIERKKCLWRSQLLDSAVTGIGFLKGGKWLVAVGGGYYNITTEPYGPAFGEITIWGVKTGQVLARSKELDSPVHCMATSPDGKTMAVSNQYYPGKGIVHVFSIKSLEH